MVMICIIISTSLRSNNMAYRDTKHLLIFLSSKTVSLKSNFRDNSPLTVILLCDYKLRFHFCIDTLLF